MGSRLGLLRQCILDRKQRGLGWPGARMADLSTWWSAWRDPLAAPELLPLIEAVGRVLLGKEQQVRLAFSCLLAGGHLLIEDRPGMGKSTLAEALARVFALDFKRVSFTSDLLPADLTGLNVFNSAEASFRFQPGPLFTQVLLADEINRAPAKSQAALLEVMQEQQVSIEGRAMNVPAPFMTIATQNPIEQEGTYPLPEAQLDRFMFNIYLEYPSYKDEVEIVKNTTSGSSPSLSTILTGDEILFFQQLIRKIPISDNVLEYAVTLSNKSRPQSELSTSFVNNYISWGAGPRASQCLVLGAKCHAAINGKYSPDIEDVQAVAKYVLRHRVVRNYKAEAEGISINEVVQNLL